MSPRETKNEFLENIAFAKTRYKKLVIFKKHEE